MSAEKQEPLSAAEFGRLFMTYRARFEVIARRYVRSDAVAEDIVSDSFMAFWESSARISPPLAGEGCPAYILTIVRNRCLDWLRAQSLHSKHERQFYELRRRVIAADIRSLEAIDPRELFSDEVETIVRRSLEELPELTRKVFEARRLEGRSYKEIAAEYGISERRVEFEQEKAIRQLRVALKDYLPALFLGLLLGEGYF